MFPTDRSMGQVLLRDQAERHKWQRFADARGVVTVPVDSVVILRVGDDGFDDLSPLAELAPADLQILDLAFSLKLDGTQLDFVKGSSGLEGLTICETNTGDEHLLWLDQLINLRWLDVGDTLITDKTLMMIGRLPLLEELVLINDGITNEEVDYLRNCFKLKRLILTGTNTDDGCISNLSEFGRLEYLGIRDTKISYLGFAKLKRILPNCRMDYHEFARD